MQIETVSIIIPTYNSAAQLQCCLDTLLRQKTSITYEIVVSDDGSTDSTKHLMKAYESEEKVVYCWHPNHGRAKNRNFGAACAKGDAYIFLDADMLASEELVIQHLHTLSQLGTRGVVMGAVPVAPECRFYAAGRFLTRKWEKRLEDLSQEPDNIFLMQSGNFSIRKQFFHELGGFDVSFHKYGGEDTDFFARAAQKGAQFAYSADAKAYHLVDLNFRSIYEKLQQAKSERKRVRKKHPFLKGYCQKRPNTVGKKSIKSKIWRLWRSWRYSKNVLLLLLPFLEAWLPDEKTFLIYDSLLAEALSD